MFAQKTKITILGLAISLTLIGCGPAFQANKGKAGPASVLSKTGDTASGEKQPNKTPEQLANETQARLQREEAIEKNGKEGAFVKTNDLANLYISGVKAAREGEELVFSALVKESSEDNKGSVEIRAKIPVTADDVPTQVAAANVNLQTIKGAKTTVEPKAEEYTLTSTCQAGCQKVIVHLQRKNEGVAYGAEFVFEITGEDKAVGTLLGSSLKADADVTNFDKALVDAGVEVETAGSEATGGEAAVAAANPETAPAVEKTEEKAAESAEDKATANDVAATAATAEADDKASTVTEKVAAMTVTESKTTGASALAAAKVVADPAKKPSKTQAQISREITVKEAIRQNKVIVILKESVKLNGLKSDMMKALAGMRKAELNYSNINKGVANFFGANSIEKSKALDLVKAERDILKAKTKLVKKQISVVENLTKDLNNLNNEMKSLKSQLAAAK